MRIGQAGSRVAVARLSANPGEPERAAAAVRRGLALMVDRCRMRAHLKLRDIPPWSLLPRRRPAWARAKRHRGDRYEPTC